MSANLGFGALPPGLPVRLLDSHAQLLLLAPTSNPLDRAADAEPRPTGDQQCPTT